MSDEQDPGYVYDEAAALRYDAAIAAHPDEIDFYHGLAGAARKDGLPTLEIACGTGRVAVPLAERGISITGIDNSPAMLDRARHKAATLESATWVEADMRDFDLPDTFGLATIPAGSFQLLLTTDDQLDCLRTIHRHLTPGGRLALDVANPNIIQMADWLRDKRGAYLRFPPRDYIDLETGAKVLSWRSQEFHPATQRQVSLGFTEELDEEGDVVRRTYGKSMTLRYLYRYEAEHLLARCGFEIEHLYGTFDCSVYRSASPQMLFVARRLA